MMDVNSMVEVGEHEVWLHGDVNSMVVIELGGVVEGGLKLGPSLWYELRVASRAFFSTAARYSTVRTVKNGCE